MDDKAHKFAFQFKNTIKKCISNNRFGSKSDEIEKGVYVINCKNCNLSYVGETGRKLSIRIEEHSRAVRYQDRNSALAAHCWDEDHQMNFKDSKIIYRNNDARRRRVVEGALINLIPVVPGKKYFNNLDTLNSCQVIYEANLSSFVKAANDRGLLPRPIQPPHNPCTFNPDIFEDQHPLGRINMINDHGQVVRRSRRINPI